MRSSNTLRIVRLALMPVITASAAAACWLTTGLLPRNATPFTPPAVYSRWWAMTEACAGRAGDLASVRWYQVPGGSVITNDEPAAAFWTLRGNQIVVAKELVENGDVVRHEMLHALLKVRTHPAEQFLGTCASILSCGGACGPWQAPRPDYVVLSPDILVVGSQIELYPREVDGQRWLALQIVVRNPRDSAVLVAAPGDPVRPTTFMFDLRSPIAGFSGGEVALDSSVLFFQPLETKRWLFEFRVASDLSRYHVTSGTYQVSGGYARRWAGYESIVVNP